MEIIWNVVFKQFEYGQANDITSSCPSHIILDQHLQAVMNGYFSFAVIDGVLHSFCHVNR